MRLASYAPTKTSATASAKARVASLHVGKLGCTHSTGSPLLLVQQDET